MPTAQGNRQYMKGGRSSKSEIDPSVSLFVSPRPREYAIRRHEPRQHRRDKLRGFELLSCLAAEHFCVGHEGAVDGTRQLDREPDRPIVRNDGELELQHWRAPQL